MAHVHRHRQREIDRGEKGREEGKEGVKINRCNKIIHVCMYIVFIKNRIGKCYISAWTLV